MNTLLVPRARTALLAATYVLVSVAAGVLASNTSFVRIVLALALAATIVAVGLRQARFMLFALVFWLAALGLIRRFVSVAFASAKLDPLLLLEPLALVVVLLAARELGAFERRTRLSDAVTALSVVVVLAAVNPLQGSVSAGVTSLIFFVPLLAFWVGRVLSDRSLERVVWLYAILAVPAAAYGMFQVLSGLPSWDQTWVDSTGYTALHVIGSIRPFSTFASSAEYVSFLGVGIVSWVVLGRRRSVLATCLCVSLLAVAVFYTSARGAIVTGLLALAVMAAAALRLRPAYAVTLAALAIGVVPTVARHLVPAASTASASSGLVQHQVQGLANPFDPSHSTALLHVRLMVDGVAQGFRNPVGRGLSAVTIAGKKFGQSGSNTETDPSNTAIALGLPGLLIYLAILAIGVRLAYTEAQTRSPVALAVLGILVVLVFQWLNGGEYSVAYLPWLVLGWLDARTSRPRAVTL